MNNVYTIAVRSVVSRHWASSWRSPALSIERVAQCSRPRAVRHIQTSSHNLLPLVRHESCLPASSRSLRHRYLVPNRCLHNSTSFRKLKPYQATYEKGLPFRPEPLSDAELQDAFGQDRPDPEFAQRLLSVLYARMLDGTLDLPPPEDIEDQLQDYSDGLVPAALEWLRTNHPIDEEAAIAARLKREESRSEQRTPSQLIQRAEALGLYKPQSGSYDLPLSGKKGDVYSPSILERVREANKVKDKLDEEVLDKQIDQILEKARETQQIQQNRDTALETRPEQALEPAVPEGEIKPPNVYERWRLKARNRATTDLTLESPEIAQTSRTRRLLPSLLFTLGVSAACYFYATMYTPPTRRDRIMPTTSLATATVLGLFALNAGILVLWRFPPAWTLFNRYLISVPALPRAPSMLGNVLSHQSMGHLLSTFFWVTLFGIPLHEDVGRGWFLAVYLLAGTWGSFASLTNFTLRGILNTSSLGGSGATAGIIGAYCTVHAFDRFQIKTLPDEWRERLSVPGITLLSIPVILEVIGYFGPLKNTDRVSHLAGYAVGAVCGWAWRRESQGEARREYAVFPETIMGPVFEEGGKRVAGDVVDTSINEG